MNKPLRVMKFSLIATAAILLGGFCSSVSLGQRLGSRKTDYDVVTSYRVGTQNVNFSGLNQALQQAGYGTLPNQVTTISVVSQFSGMNRPLAFHYEFGVSLNSGMKVNNGLNKASAGFYYFKIGASYRVIKSDRFQLAPQLSFISLPFHVKVDKIGSSAPSLSTVLANPASDQTSTFSASSGGVDAGLTASLRIPHGSPQQVNCVTVERSFTIGLDAGYRFVGQMASNREMSNPTIQLSGWYAGLRLGLGLRSRSTASPVTP